MLRFDTNPIVYSLNTCSKLIDVGWNVTGFQHDLIYYIETNSHQLRDEFVQRIDDRLLTKDQETLNSNYNLNLIEIFVANSDLNGRSNYLRHPEINIILKLYALSKIVDENDSSGVRMWGNFSSLERHYIDDYFKSNGWKKPYSNRFNYLQLNLEKIYLDIRFFLLLIKNSMFFCYQNLLRKIISSSPFSKKNRRPDSCQKDILFLSYRQINDLDLDKDHIDTIWNKLPSLCTRYGYSFDHLYLSLAKKAKDIIKEKQVSNSISECSFFFIDFFCQFNAWKHFFKTLRVRRLWEISDQSRNGDGIDNCLSMFFKKTLSSFYLHQNFFLQSGFNQFFIQAPIYRFVLYPMENYHWEKNLISTLKHHCPDTKVIGVPNTAVRFWDLKFLVSGFPLEARGMLGDNRPDLLCAPCESVRTALINSGWDARTIIVTEALRYLASEQKIDVKTMGSRNKIVIVGDYVVAETHRLLDFVQLDVLQKDFEGYEIVLKLHPSQVDGSISPVVPSTVQIATDDLNSVLENAAVAICSSSTNGVIDCWESGVEIVVIGDKGNLDFCPISYFEGVSMVYDTTELRDLLQAVLSEVKLKKRIQRSYFERGPGLSRWSSLLRDGF